MQTNKETTTARVRILIMGAAGVGKTTILKKICSETEMPIVRNPEGDLIQELDTLVPTTARGLHDINLEITYPSRPGFVFHDSRGIEAGSTNELNEIRRFLDRRAKREQGAVHVIWYCVLASSCRPLVHAERQFFEQDRGKVPVIVVFTKQDGLVAKAYNDLKREGLTGGDAYQGVAARADQILQTHFVKPLMEMAHPPMGYVTFKGLHKPGGQCAELTRQTVDALGHDQNLQMMFVLASHYDLEARLMALVKQLQMNGTDEAIIRATIAYFPHLWHTGRNWWVYSSAEMWLMAVSILLSELILLWSMLPWQSSATMAEYQKAMTPFVHSIALVMSTNLVADQVRGFAALADICFWTSQQSKSSKLGKEELLSRLQHALDQYQQDKKDVIIQAICHMPNVSKEAVKHLILQHGQFSPVAKAQAL